MAEVVQNKKSEKTDTFCVVNRLMDLKEGIEQQALDNADFKDLERNLDKIRQILKNNPNQIEINSAKEYIQNLKLLKEKYELQKTQNKEMASLNLGNLKEEFELYSEIRNSLDIIKISGKAERIRECISFNDAFVEVNSPLILDIRKKFSEIIDLKFNNLEPKQKENIKLGILGKMLNLQALGMVTNNFTGKLENINKSLVKSDFDSLSKTFEETEIFGKNQEDIGDKIFKNFLTEVTALKTFVDQNKENPNLNNFLNSPKNISEFNEKTDLSNYTQPTSLEEKKFFKSVKDKLENFDDKFIQAEKMTDKVLDYAAKYPEFISNGIIGFFSFLCTLPVIGDLLKKILGVNGNKKEEIEEELKAQNIERKSLNNLKTYGIRYNEKWELIESKNNPAISIFKDKDLSKMSYKKMRKFFDFCKKNNLDINAKDFWYNVFENKAVKTEIKDDKGNKTEKIVNFNFEINVQRDFYESSKEPNGEFYGKLDKFVDSELKVAEVKQEQPETQPAPTPKKRTPQTTVASGGVIPLFTSHNSTNSEAPNQTQENNKDLPEKLVFNKESQTAEIDGKKYNVGVGYIGTNLPIINAVLDKTSGNLELDLGTFGIKKFDKEANIKLYKELKANGSYSWNGEGFDSGKSLNITAV